MLTKTLIVKSVYRLTEAELASIVEGMGIKTSTNIKLENQVDPSLLGGIVIKFDGYYLDMSLRQKLKEIVASLS